MTWGIFLSTLFAVLTVVTWGTRRHQKRISTGTFDEGTEDYATQQRYFKNSSEESRRHLTRELTFWTIAFAVGTVIQVAAELHKAA